MVIGPPTVVFRVDAGVHIGSGHVMRCLALAATLGELGIRSHFVCRAHEGHLGALIEDQGYELHLLPEGEPSMQNWLGTDWASDAEETLEAMHGLKPDWLVVDHYALDARWERCVRAAVGRCLAIDDLADRPHLVDLLLDQNLQSAPYRYDSLVPLSGRKLLGPRYSLLRPEFVRLRRLQHVRARRGLNRILAFAGGNDSTDLLGKVCQAWRGLDAGLRPKLILVVGQNSQNLAQLREFAEGETDCELYIQTSDMAALISSVDLMINAGGSINWERCCLGVPALVCETAANQRDNVRELSRSRTAIALGRAEKLQCGELRRWMRRLADRPALLDQLGRRAASVVDGLGARRVALAMFVQSLELRRAVPADAHAAWIWRNEESTRRYFTDPAPIPLTSHCAWWNETLKDGNRFLLIAEIFGTPVGVLRFDVDQSQATISIYIDPKSTGIGIGTRLLFAGKEWIAAHRPGVTRLVAVIHSENRASISSFTAAGFQANSSSAYWFCHI